MSAVAGYESGPDAPLRATAAALRVAEGARAVLLVEGISDQIAVEAAARALGRDLAAEGIAVQPAGGAQALPPLLARFGPQGAGLPLAGLCDVAETAALCRALALAGLGTPRDAAGLARLGFHLCDRDLEDELIRAAGDQTAGAVIAALGDAAAFRTFGRQPGWRDAPFADRLRRFVGAGARRKLRYAQGLVTALGPDRLPPPLRSVVEAL